MRNFSVREDKRKNRLMDKEDKATTEKALDPKTRVLIYKLVNGGLLDSVNGVISMGKEAVIFHADGGPGPQDCHRPKPYNVPKECVLKVFKTTLNEFKTRDKYIRVRNIRNKRCCIAIISILQSQDDYRFRKRSIKQNPRKILNMWAEKVRSGMIVTVSLSRLLLARRCGTWCGCPAAASACPRWCSSGTRSCSCPS